MPIRAPSNRCWRMGAIGLVLGFAAGCGDEGGAPADARPVVNFYNWYSDINPDALPAFTQATGIEVVHDVYDSDETLEAKLLVGHSGYDLVVPASAPFAKERMAGLFLELDHSRLRNYAGIDPVLLGKLAEVDPGARYGVPYSQGTTGIGYNIDQIVARLPDAPLDSWDLLFAPDVVRKLQECGVAMLDSPGDVIPIALNYLGRDPQSLSSTDLDDAIAMLAKTQPFIRYFDSSQSMDDLASGEICLAMVWSGSVAQSRRASAGLDLRYVVPKEGSLVWFEVMAIPADARNVDSAYALIDFLLDPRIAAGMTNVTYYASGVTEARQLVEAEIRDDEAVYPTPEVMQRLFAVPVETQDYQSVRQRRWTAMKAGQIH